MKLRAVFILMLFAGIQASPNVVRRLAWVTPAYIQTLLSEQTMAVHPDLPVPILDHEQPYTRGLDNTLTWTDSMSAVYSRLGEMHMIIQFFMLEAAIAGMDTVWGFVDAGATSAAFVNMPEGISVSYRFKYYARDNLGTIYISPWSRPEITIQDASPPELISFNVQGLQEPCGDAWVMGSQISLDIRAADPNGQIMEVAIQETSEEVDLTLFNNLDARPRAYLDTTIEYSLLTDRNKPLTLKCWVIDVAEFSSDVSSKMFFYQNPDPSVVCFPNPFLPDVKPCTSIKVEKMDVREAKIFDPFGNLIKVLSKDPDTEISFRWDGTNEQGEQVSKGGYLCVINGDRDLYCKIAVIR